MDLISIAEILWRRKFITIPVIILTAMAAFYVVKVKPPVYQAQSSLLMVPPSPPTAAQIAADPALGRINSNNPYINYGDLSVIADTLIDVVTDPANEQVLVAQGADPRYELTLSTDYGNPPIIDITGIGRTPAIAIRSAQLVTKTAQQDLVTLQSSQGVNSLYMIKGTQLVTPAQASQSVSSKLRTLIAVLAMGILVLFAGVSLIEAVEKRRSQKARRVAANARTSPEEQLRGPFTSRYRTRPGWAPDAAGTSSDRRADEPAGAFTRAEGASHGRTSRAAPGAPSSAGHPDPPAPRREPRPAPEPPRPPAAAPPVRPPAVAPPARPPAVPPPARQPAVAPPARQPLAAPPPARQPAVAPPARQPLAAPPARQPVAAPPARPGPLDRLPAGPTGRPGSPGQ